MPATANTLSRRFAVVLTATMAILLVVAALALEIFSARVLTREFDGSLEDAAQTFMALLDQEGDELDFDDEALPGEYFEGEDGFFFVLTHDDAELAAYPELADDVRGTAPQPNAGIRDMNLNERHARVLSYSFYPRFEIEEDREPEPLLLAPASGVAPARELVTIVVGRYTAGLDGVRQELRLLTFAIFAITLLLAFVLIHRSTRFGLSPVNDLAAQVRRLGPESPRLHVSTRTVPRELQPFIQAINGLLARIDDAYRRQRDFTSNVAHELRTPVAELKVLSDVAEKWPDDREMTRKTLSSVAEIATDMQTIIERLLDLSRAGPAAAERQTIHLGRHLEQQLESMGGGADGHRFRLHACEAPVVESDPHALSVIVRNLLTNALDYSPANTPIELQVSRRNGSFDLTVSNEAPGLTLEDLDYVFDRFWRKEESRTSRRHAGLGLAIAKTYADALGLALLARKHDGDRVSFTLAGLSGAPDPHATES